MSSCMFLLSFCGLVGVTLEHVHDPALRKMHDEGAIQYREGRFDEAGATFARLLEEEADYYDAYTLYWDTLKVLHGPNRMLSHIDKSVERMSKIPLSFRTRAYYVCILDGLARAERKEELEQYREEMVERFPRDLRSQQALLELGRDAGDLKKAVGFYQRYLDDYCQNASWCLGAARNAFELVANNRELFSKERLVSAAKRYDMECRNFFPDPNRPGDYLACLEKITAGLCNAEAWDECGEYVGRARDFYTGIENSRVKERYPFAKTFEGAAFMYHAQKKEWDTVRELGRGFFKTIISGDAFPFKGVLKDEAYFRAQYAQALLETGKLDEARAQVAAAAVLSPRYVSMLETMHRTHPMSEEDRALFDYTMHDKLQQALEQSGRAPLDLIKEEAPQFELERITGGKLALESLKGRPVLMTFWATWCGPCKWLLADLTKLYPEFKGSHNVEVLAINIDEDRDKALAYLKDMDTEWPFTLLYSNERVNAQYQTLAIPKLILIDGDGMIRTTHRGYGPNMANRLRGIVESFLLQARLDSCFPKGGELTSG